jgi:hypothetical protein
LPVKREYPIVAEVMLKDVRVTHLLGLLEPVDLFEDEPFKFQARVGEMH